MSYGTNKSTASTPFWERWVGYDRQRSLNSSYDNQRINKEDQKDYEKYVQIDDELLPLQKDNTQMSSYGACLRTRNRTNNFVKHKVNSYLLLNNTITFSKFYHILIYFSIIIWKKLHSKQKFWLQKLNLFSFVSLLEKYAFPLLFFEKGPSPWLRHNLMYF